jgi:hypothetical protein
MKHAWIWTIVLVVSLQGVLGDDGVFGDPPQPEDVAGVTSTFEKGTEGWTSSDGEHALEAEGGHLLVRDITEEWHWLDAPGEFIGNWSGVSGIEMRIRPDRDARHPLLLELRGPGGSARLRLHTRFLRGGEWRTIRVPLREAFWEARGWSDLIRNVTRFRIRLDLHAATDAVEVHAIDRIALVAKRRADSADSAEGWTCQGGTIRVDEGRLEVTDVGSGWCWIRAPERFRGDWSRKRFISFSVRGDARGPIEQALRLQIESDAGMAIYDFPVDAAVPGEWRRHQVPLDPEHWAVSGDWDAVIASVSDFWMRVDLTTAHGGKDVSAIDDVRLTSYGR